jgi:Ca2+-binding RTX toxin-like protein
MTDDRSGIIVTRGGIPDTLYGYETVKFVDKTVTVASVLGNTIAGTSAGDLIDNAHSVAGQRKTTQFADTVRGNDGNDVLYGHAGDDKIWGGNGDDTLYGGYHNDQLYGGNGADKLDGGPGSDFLNGEGGFDSLIGGAGDDVFVVSRTGQFDRVIEYLNGGIDTVRVGETYTLPTNVENATITGNAAVDITGNALGNLVFGNAAANTIRGLAGNDTLCGGGGNDRIVAGTGVDYLCGGIGRDTFVFAAVTEIGNGIANRDVIGDFVSGLDRIDLSAIDANAGLSGNQAFSFIGTSAFSGQVGQVNYVIETGKLVVQGDLNGDKVADFQLVLLGGVSSLQIGDFIL